jgi:hypothetical protein
VSVALGRRGVVKAWPHRTYDCAEHHALVDPLRAIAAGNTVQQSAVIMGPAAGGLLYAFGPQAVYMTCVISFLAAGIFISLVRFDRAAAGTVFRLRGAKKAPRPNDVT